MSQAPGITCKQREIVLVPFPYSDLSSRKQRPVLIISNDEYNRKFEDVVVCVITSRQYEDEYSISLNNEDLDYGILPEPSVIKIHKLFTIHKSKIIKKFSIINTKLFKSVRNKINLLIKETK